MSEKTVTMPIKYGEGDLITIAISKEQAHKLNTEGSMLKIIHLEDIVAREEPNELY